MKKIVLQIEGMHCTSCAMNIDGDLEDNVKGIKNVNTSYAKQQTEVEFEDKEVSIEKIVGQIKQTGYEAHVKNE